MRNLSIILVFFCSTYVLRFISDKYIVPRLAQPQHWKLCTLEGRTTYCIDSVFIQYYLWTSLLFDFAPLGIIVFFHHRSFRLEKGYKEFESQSLVMTTTGIGTGFDSDLGAGGRNTFLNNRPNNSESSQGGPEESILLPVIVDDVKVP